MVSTLNYNTMYDSCMSVLEITNMMIENQQELSDDMYTNLISEMQYIHEGSVGDFIGRIVDFIKKWASNIGEAIMAFVSLIGNKIHNVANKIREKESRSDAFDKSNIMIDDIKDIRSILKDNFIIINPEDVLIKVEKDINKDIQNINKVDQEYINKFTKNNPDIFNNYSEIKSLYVKKIKLTKEYLSFNDCTKLMNDVDTLIKDTENLKKKAEQYGNSLIKRIQSSLSEKIKSGKYNDAQLKTVATKIQLAVVQILSFNSTITMHRLNLIKDYAEVTLKIMKVWTGTPLNESTLDADAFDNGIYQDKKIVNDYNKTDDSEDGKSSELWTYNHIVQ